MQKMADLPVDILEPSPPFTYCSFYIKEGRNELQRYGCLFTGMTSRDTQEVANYLSTDSFLNALRRFLAIRGPIRQLRSDQGTHFSGAKSELNEALGNLKYSGLYDE